MISCVGEGGHAQATVCMSHLPPCARQFLSCSMLHRPGWQAHKLLGLLCLRLSYLGWSTMVIATSATVFNFYVILETRIHVFLLAWQALYPISILVSCWDFFKTPNGKFCGPGQLISCLCTVGYSLSNLSNSKSSH